MVAVAALVALALGVAAQAGGNGATKVDLLVGIYPNPAPNGGNSVIWTPPTPVGDVIFNPTANGMLQVTINLKDGAPDTLFPQVFLVPLGVWGNLPDQGYTMTTNSQGKATLHFARPIPDGLDENAFVKAIVRVSRYGPVYVTDQHYLDWYKR
jgi:hypothetical protein